MCFLATAFIVLPLPIVLALLPSVSVREALLISAPLMALGIGLPYASSYLVIQRTFYAFEDGKHPFIFMAITMGFQALALIVGAALLPPTQWIVLIGAVITVSFILPYPPLMRMLRTPFAGNTAGSRILRAYAKATLAEIVAAAVGLLCRNAVYTLVGAHIGRDDGSMNWGQAVLAAILLTIITVVYLAVLWALRSEELTSVIAMVTSRIPGMRTTSPDGRISPGPATGSTRTNTPIT